MAIPIYPAEPDIGEPGTGGDGGGTGGTGGGGSSGGNVGTAIFRFSYIKTQAESVLKVLAYATLASPDDLQLTAYLTVGGIVRQVTPVNLILDSQRSQAVAPVTIPAFIRNLPVGGHEIIFSIRNNEPDGPLTIRAGAYIDVTEIKRAAL